MSKKVVHIFELEQNYLIMSLYIKITKKKREKLLTCVLPKTL